MRSAYEAGRFRTHLVGYAFLSEENIEDLSKIFAGERKFETTGSTIRFEVVLTGADV